MVRCPRKGTQVGEAACISLAVDVVAIDAVSRARAGLVVRKLGAHNVGMPLNRALQGAWSVVPSRAHGWVRILALAPEAAFSL